MEKHTVVISREWSHPLIHIDVYDTELQVSMTLAEFVDAMVKEADLSPVLDAQTAAVGNPTLLFTQAGLRAKLGAAVVSKQLLSALSYAADAVCAKMKADTARAM